MGLDVLRGGALALMLLTPVTGTDGSYPQLGHAAWDGFTVADAILPTFLVAGGASLAMLLRPPVSPATRLRLVRRTIALVVLGVAYNAVGQPLDLSMVRLTGVLQLIGLSGGLAAAAVLLWRRVTDRTWPLIASAVVLPAVHGLVLARDVACPDGLARCSPWWSLEAPLLGAGRLYAQGGAGFDPEGIGPILAAAGLVLAGYLVMDRVRRAGTTWRVLLPLAVLGVGLVVAGLLLHQVQPINKRLHTPAFTALAAGIAVCGLVGLTAVLDRGRGGGLRRLLADPLITLGRNALVVFLAERVLLVALAQTPVTTAAGTVSAQEALLTTWLPAVLPAWAGGVRVHLALTTVLFAVILLVTYGMRALRWRVVL